MLREINRAIRYHYEDEVSFRDWSELYVVADEYLARQRTKIKGSSIRDDKSGSPETAPTPDTLLKRLLQQLPIPTYTRLFGVEPYVDVLLQSLQDQQTHQIISIQGIGGIGKSALADHVVRKMITEAPYLNGLVWISAKQEFLTEAGIVKNKTQIRLESLFDDLGLKLGLTRVLRLPLIQKVDHIAALLRAEPYLVVIDNLETVQDFQGLVPWLEKLAAPTKFLLTSREHVPSLTTVVSVRLEELDENASLQLIQHIAAEKRIDDFEPFQVYELVGGNPLAIILTVNLMKDLPPTVVLESVQLGSTEDIYRYVYQKSWSALTDDAREILLGIQRAGDEADWKWLSTMMDLSDRDLQDALRHLIDLSLVQPQRTANDEHFYVIHRLTSTFLRTEVLGWK